MPSNPDNYCKVDVGRALLISPGQINILSTVQGHFVKDVFSALLVIGHGDHVCVCHCLLT